MKEMTEHERLLADVLGDEALYASTLQAGLGALRRKRRRRAVRAVILALLPLAGLLALMLQRLHSTPQEAAGVVPAGGVDRIARPSATGSVRRAAALKSCGGPPGDWLWILPLAHVFQFPFRDLNLS